MASALGSHPQTGADLQGQRALGSPGPPGREIGVGDTRPGSGGLVQPCLSPTPRGPEEPRRLPEPTPEAGKCGGGGGSWCRKAWTQSAGPKDVGPDLTPCQGASIPGD